MRGVLPFDGVRAPEFCPRSFPVGEAMPGFPAHWHLPVRARNHPNMQCSAVILVSLVSCLYLRTPASRSSLTCPSSESSKHTFGRCVWFWQASPMTDSCSFASQVPTGKSPITGPSKLEIWQLSVSPDFCCLTKECDCKLLIWEVSQGLLGRVGSTSLEGQEFDKMLIMEVCYWPPLTGEGLRSRFEVVKERPGVLARVHGGHWAGR